jgi:lipopolysaccharide transport system permease protein
MNNQNYKHDRLPNIVIEPGMVSKGYWTEIWKYRQLLIVLAWRDISARYKQTLLGLIWAVIRPILIMIVLVFVFSSVANIKPTPGVPYALVVFCGLLPWQFFSSSISEISDGLIGNANLITKIYFPRLIIPLALLLVVLVDFIIGLFILIALLFFYQFQLHINLILLPIFIVLMVLSSLGPGLLIASLNVKYRDFRYVIPFFIQFGLYFSPVGYSSSLVPEHLKFFYYLNPVVAPIDGFRWAILGGDFQLNPLGFAISTFSSILLLIIGLRKFRSLESRFADLI